MKRIAIILTGAALAIAGCGDAEPTLLESPDAAFWEGFPDGEEWRNSIDEDIDAANCEGLQETRDSVDGSSVPDEVRSQVLEFIDAAREELGC